MNEGPRTSALRRRLAGRRVLVAGRSSFNFVLITDLLQEAGCHVGGPFRTVAELAAAVASDRPDAAVVDVGAAATRMWEIVDWLERRQVPSVLVGSCVPGGAMQSQVVAWPMDEAILLSALLGCIDSPARPLPTLAVKAGSHHQRV